MMKVIRTTSSIGIAILMLGVGCAGPTVEGDSAFGNSNITVLDADPESRRYTLYVRKPDGRWFHGAGKFAFERMAPDVMTVSDTQRQTILDAMRRAGWLDGDLVVDTGTGPRYLEVKMSGNLVNRKFEMLATDDRFDPGSEEVLSVLREVAQQRYDEVLDALPKGSPSGS